MLSQLRAGAAALRMSDPDFRQGYPFTVASPLSSRLKCAVRRLDFTFLCQTPDGKGEVIFGREWGLMLMQIFNVNRFVSANPPAATPRRAPRYDQGTPRKRCFAPPRRG